MKRRYMTTKYESPSLPVFSTIVMWLLLDRLRLPSVWVGAIWAVWIILVIIRIASYIYYLIFWDAAEPVWEDHK